MLHFLDPDLNEIPLLVTTVQSRLISAGKQVFLDVHSDSPWEQALVIYIDEQRYGHQLGSFIRPTSLTIPPQAQDYTLHLVAFHKRSQVNPDLPWVASEGQSVGPITIAWDDSAADGDFRDLRLNWLTD